MNRGWKLVKKRLEEIFRTYIDRRESARSRGYSGGLYSYSPGIERLRIYLKEANADDLGDNLLPWMTGLQVIQAIYEYPNTPTEIKKWIDKVAAEEDVRVGKRIIIYRDKEEVRKKRREERAKKLKPGMLVSSGATYGIVTRVDDSYVYANAVISGYRVYIPPTREMIIPLNETRIPTSSTLKRFFKGWEKYIREEVEFENKWELTTRYSVKDEDNMKKAKRIVRKLGYKV